jgi:hypothetical protein
MKCSDVAPKVETGSSSRWNWQNACEELQKWESEDIANEGIREMNEKEALVG